MKYSYKNIFVLPHLYNFVRFIQWAWRVLSLSPKQAIPICSWGMSLGLAAIGSSQVMAAGLEVSPISLSLPPGVQASSFVFSNAGQNVLHAQARVYRWTQDANGEDVLSPTQDLLLSPPILSLQPQAQQEIRVLINPSIAPTLGSAEGHYRLIVDEIPAPAAPSSKRSIRLLLRYSIPIFTHAEEDPKTQLQWQLQDAGAGKTWVSIRNMGSARAQLGRTWLQKTGSDSKAEAQATLSHGLWAYVLPGHTVKRRVDVPITQLQDSRLTLMSTINGDEVPVPIHP